MAPPVPTVFMRTNQWGPKTANNIIHVSPRGQCDHSDLWLRDNCDTNQ